MLLLSISHNLHFRGKWGLLSKNMVMYRLDNLYIFHYFRHIKVNLIKTVWRLEKLPEVLLHAQFVFIIKD